jgi:hypothetical protein
MEEINNKIGDVIVISNIALDPLSKVLLFINILRKKHHYMLKKMDKNI